MARKPRIEFEGALYHVITRGNQRQEIFRSSEDYVRYLRILDNYKSRYNYVLHAYVLMGNHVHLLIETKEVALSKILQGINQSFTMYFNRKYETVGHLFQGRYKAILCDQDSYLLSLVKYVHANPLRAGVAKTIDEYPWSSHGYYAEQTKNKSIVDTDFILNLFSRDKKKARRSYLEYMRAEGILTREEVYATVDQRIIGDEKFVEKVIQKTGRKELGGRRKHGHTLLEIVKATEETFGISLGGLREKKRGENLRLGRRVISIVAREYGYKGQEISEYLRRDPSVITRYLQEGSRLISEVDKVHVILRRYSNKQV
jgi:REP element-mobilizing transposase RayT